MSVVRPLIGITTYLTRAAWGAWDLDAALVPAAYVRAVAACGRRAAARSAGRAGTTRRSMPSTG